MKIISLFLITSTVFTSCRPMEEITYLSQGEAQILPLSLCPLAKQEVSFFKKKPFRILSIDGGGVRGIIPARILAEFEKRSGKPASELFDFMVGNSTGGVIVLALNTPDATGKSKYQASDLVGLYYQQSKNIFKTSIFRKLYTGFGLWGPKYDRSEYDKILLEFFGNIRMSQLIKPTVVISYNLNAELPHVWSREFAREKPYRDFLVSDIAAATSSAPTYFAPKLLTDMHNNIEYQVDGGIFANNPESAAISLAYRLNNTLELKDIVLISLGTGTIKLATNPVNLGGAGIIGWVINANLIDVMMGAQSDWYDAEIGKACFNSCRLQFELTRETSAMDNSSQNNLDTLIKLTEKYIDDNSDLIDHIVTILNEN